MAELTDRLHSEPAREPRVRAGKAFIVPAAGIAAIWIMILLVGAAEMLAHERIGAPNASEAKGALLALAGGDLGRATEGLGALLLVAFAQFGAPLLVLAALVAIETLARDRTLHSRWSDPAWMVQAVLLTCTASILLAITQLKIWPETIVRIQGESGGALQWGSRALLLVAAVVAVDILNYWVHRAQHRFAFLWRFHSVHHGQKLDVLHNINHPIDLVAGYLLAVLPVSIILRVDRTEFLLLSAYFMVQTTLNHMRAPVHLGPLGLLLSDNRYHFIHHSRDPADYNSNFAARFPFIDMMFGTYRPRRKLLPETGLPDRPPPSGVREHLFAKWPPDRDA